MKKLCVLIVAIIVTMAVASSAMASTIGVNVSPGASIAFDKVVETESEDWFFTANMGLSEKFLFKVGFTEDVLFFGGRYEIINNLATGFSGTFADEAAEYSIDLRGKVNITEQLDLVGVLSYSYVDVDDGDNEDAFDLLGQVEYKIGEIGALNLGLDYWRGEGESITSYTVGAEFYVKKVCIYFDYSASLDSDDEEDNTLAVGMEISF